MKEWWFPNCPKTVLSHCAHVLNIYGIWNDIRAINMHMRQFDHQQRLLHSGVNPLTQKPYANILESREREEEGAESIWIGMQIRNSLVQFHLEVLFEKCA